MNKSSEEHSGLVQAILDGDMKAAQSCMSGHVANSALNATSHISKSLPD